MRILYVDLKPSGNDYAEFRYFWDNPNQYQSRQLPLAQIADLINRAETDYYTRLAEEKDYIKTGQALYNWLDGTERYLQRALDLHRREGIVLAISASEGLAHLPWEILHDGKRFLVEATPAIIPIRWVNQSNSQPLIQEDKPANRALNLLFMACSPDGSLEFEREEGYILEATKRNPLSLIVEESGCLEELGYLLNDYEQGHFDVLHLTGHATFLNDQPYFITETEFGEAKDSTADEIVEKLQFQIPKLIFLSGCRTGFSGAEGTIPSMAEALFKGGATAVLGWGQNVLDKDAIVASGTLYQALSTGKNLLEALALTYKALIKQKTRDWHLLRLYVAQVIPGALVTRGQKFVPMPSSVEFLDSEGHVRVATRQSFVGRRRELQKCLQFLKTSFEKIGVLIYGFGGLGKSTVASRLCDRLSNKEKIIWSYPDHVIDQPRLVTKIADKLRKAEIRSVLLNHKEDLKYRLRDVFESLAQANENSFLLVFDEFEFNLEPRDGDFILKSEAAQVLEALIWAINETGGYHKIIITCRHDFHSDILRNFYKQSLSAFSESDLQKKLKYLEIFNKEDINQESVKKALNLARGNPRLLEWLNNEVLIHDDAWEQLEQYQAKPEQWEGKVIWKDFCDQIKADTNIQEILSYCLIYEIPVPLAALEVICETLPNYEVLLSRAIKLGLIEDSCAHKEQDKLYQVSRILPHIFSQIQLLKAPQVYPLYCKAFNKLYDFWSKSDWSLGERHKNEEKWREIFRLFFADKSNLNRFRQGFSCMVDSLVNIGAENAYEIEIRKLSHELSRKNLYGQLEKYLKEKKWKEADEETAWIFYLLMVLDNHENWSDLCQNLPSNILQKIDKLWINYSQDKFGFSIQRKILESVEENLDQFMIKVEWRGPAWPYNTLKFDIENSTKGHLPARWTTIWGVINDQATITPSRFFYHSTLSIANLFSRHDLI